MAVPLTITIRNPSNFNSLSLASNAEQVQISTTAPGGFGTFTFQMSEAAVRAQTFPLQQFYACDVIVTDISAQTLFEGILTDVKLHSDDNYAYYSVECSGWKLLLNEPYRNVVIDRNPSWQQMPISWNASVVRPGVIPLTIGQVSASDSTKIGWRCDVPSGTAVSNNWRNGVIAYWTPGTRLLRCKFDYDVDMNRAATFGVEIYCVDDNGGINFLSTVLAVSLVGTGSMDVDLSLFSSITSGIMMDFACSAAGTTSANMWAQLTNFRFLSTRNIPSGTSVNEPVYGHEVISDIVSKSQLLSDYSSIEQDTSYAIQQFTYPISDTQSNALDQIAAYFNRYWAVWENKKMSWSSWHATTADWVVSRDSGAQVDIDPSIVDAANVVRVQYTDAGGVQQEATVNDARQDNVYTLVGRTKTGIANLGIVSTATAATQVGSVYFPDHSYEIVGGTITLPAQARCFSQTYGTLLPAYRIRAGETVRLRDGSSGRSIFDTSSWNRATYFRITATDLDWENQTIKLTLDNSQASLDQLTARIVANQSAKYGT